ncbi:uncharacterized protein LOC111320984 [Stylophora pistillata]|uniref:Uncharacterized protein C2orf42-like n=1 Tax=Stylophora pistillata TaxID=50429 RepID=A0A2B4STE3_STYPI|nr:uncharacterized protein LOC111320984 [Stylophora pistillata]PFX32369.1 Uncharacterized protein C2orf42-like [Stylophora pistillata]
MSDETIWSDQSSEQVSNPAPILETSLMGTADDHVILRLLTGNNMNSSSSNGSEVLAKLLSGSVQSSSPSSIAVGTTIVLSSVQSPGLRKIEPKPTDSGNEGEKVEVENESNPPGRLLGINATRRGVKTCPICMKKIGYRSKQCKFCSPGKPRKRSRKSKQSKESNHFDDERDTSGVELNVVVIDGETEVATSEISSTIPEVISKEVVEDSETDAAISFGQETQEGDVVTSDAVGTEGLVGRKSYHTSLQDLIQTLLVQNQNSSVLIPPTERVESDKLSMSQPNTDQQQQQSGNDEIEQEQEQLQMAGATVGSPENAYDANSVALFLGHLAQQNGKKIRTALNPVIDNTRSATGTSSLIGVKTKRIVIEDDLSSQAKYRKIRPKSIDEGTAVVEIQTGVASIIDEDMTNNVAESKPSESQLRMLPGNATRRGVMPCQKCQCLIGCRSKVCKHCKALLNESNPPFKRNKKQQHQAVQLQIPSNSTMTVFSVRRSKVGPDHRCFVWCERNFPENRMRDVYSCDYPPCVTARELGNKTSSFLCEHAKVCRSQGSINNSRVLYLDQEKLSSEFFSEEVSTSLKDLNLKCSSKNVALVQCVSERTFVVVDQLHLEQGGSLAPDLIGFVHVRFERTKVNDSLKTEVFCSGRPCMAWNPVFGCVVNKGSSAPTVWRSLNCLHCSACLWAIASDKELAHEFQLCLDNVKMKVNNTEED